MNQYIQGERCGGQSRPCQDPTLEHTPAPPGFEPKTDEVNSMVGQSVSGFVEAEFDSGFLLMVRIGNSITYLRAAVFKPGHNVPVPAGNDDAPHVQMMRRNDARAPTKNKSRSRSQKLPVQTGAQVPSKRKYYAPQAAPSVPSVGARGTWVPVVLQPVNFQDGPPSTRQRTLDTLRNSCMTAFGGTDLRMEPSSMLPPDRSIHPGEILGSHQGIKPNDTERFIQGAMTDLMASADIRNPGSSNSSGNDTYGVKEALKSPAEYPGTVSKPEIGSMAGPLLVDYLHSTSITEPFFNYWTGTLEG